MGYGTNLAVIVAVVAAALSYHHFLPRPEFHGEPAEWRTVDNLWTEPEADRLLKMVKRGKSYTTFIQEFSSKLEEIGEGMNITAEGTCAHEMLVPNKEYTRCIFPSRLDVGRHHLFTGGWHQWREGYEKLVSRMQTFKSLTFNQELEAMPEFTTMFETPGYKTLASQACEGRTVFDPIQLGIIINLPGQEVPAHYDVPYFWGATRFTIPQWLLVVMEQSQLFVDIRVPQIQGVAYLHRWPNTTANGGDFYFYPKGIWGAPVIFPPRFNHAIVVDGSVCCHGTIPFRAAASLPILHKGRKYELRYHDNEKKDVWELYEGGHTEESEAHGEPLATYKTADLRISLVWRARCFQSEEERKKWHAQDPNSGLSVESILNTLEADLKARGRLGKSESLPPPIDLGPYLVDEYVKYPRHPNLVQSVNYCMVALKLPWAKPFFNLLGC